MCNKRAFESLVQLIHSRIKKVPLFMEWITDSLTQIINSKTPLCAARMIVNDYYAFIELIKSVSNLQSWWYSENRTLFWSSMLLN